jgi:hypothetical protein
MRKPQQSRLSGPVLHIRQVHAAAHKEYGRTAAIMFGGAHGMQLGLLNSERQQTLLHQHDTLHIHSNAITPHAQAGANSVNNFVACHVTQYTPPPAPLPKQNKQTTKQKEHRVLT